MNASSNKPLLKWIFKPLNLSIAAFSTSVASPEIALANIGVFQITKSATYHSSIEVFVRDVGR